MAAKLLLFFLVLLTPSWSDSGQQSFSSSRPALPDPKRPKNIVLMIGDGMGLSQVTAALYSNKNQLALEKFPVVGFHKAYASNDLVTDSAAGATAFSCGTKTYRGAIGVDVDSIPCRTILEEAEENGLATGMIVTSTVVHATPAAFIAHQPLRLFYEEIAADMLNTEVDFLIGGGREYFNQREVDNRDLILEFKAKDYEVFDFSQMPLQDIAINPKKNFIYFTAEKQPNPVSAGRDYLSYASRLGTQFLEKHSEKGFFLMIEGSQIDWGGHSNDADWTIKETLDFDRAISEVFNFARRRGDTLVIVTADHETGGMAVNPGSTFDNLVVSYTTNNHTGTLVPVYAYGPGAELFSGIYENTEIHKKMRQLLGFSSPSATAKF